MRLANKRTFQRTAQGLAIVSLVLTGWVCEAGVQIQSDTLLRYFERDTRDGKEKAIVPGYEYLQVDLGQLDADGISFHGQAWGRYNFGDEDFFEDRAAGEVLYGYLQYYRSSYKSFARLGRQAIFTGTSNLALDGLRIGSDLSPYFTAEAWAGQPVALEEIFGRDGDRAWGGRLEHHYGTLYAVGVSFRKIDDDSETQNKVLAIDSSLQPSQVPLRVTGYSARNMETDAWQEHSYNASINLKQFRIGASYRQYELGDYAARGRFTGTPFVWYANQDVELTQWGADATFTPTKMFEIGARYRRTDYKDEDETADFASLIAIAHFGELSQLGAELGVQQAEEEEADYTLLRGFFYWDKAPMFVSGDVVYADYGEEVADQKYSLFASLGTGMRFLKDALEARIAADYSSDPFFDSDVRGLLSLTYKFSR